ncbi:hypothetical protein R5R35_014663 [Gryllus longicercus]|uniref:Uncharacterized protein n=1 Tax=Gryllus longicercus TaxID=2509291 RepID=A0AAN9Z2X8_9ORTH
MTNKWKLTSPFPQLACRGEAPKNTALQLPGSCSARGPVSLATACGTTRAAGSGRGGAGLRLVGWPLTWLRSRSGRGAGVAHAIPWARGRNGYKLCEPALVGSSVLAGSASSFAPWRFGPRRPRPVVEPSAPRAAARRPFITAGRSFSPSSETRAGIKV